MSKVRIELNYPGIGSILRGNDMKEYVQGLARKVAQAAGKGHLYAAHKSSQRWNANVYPLTAEAKRENEEKNTLLIAMGSVKE